MFILTKPKNFDFSLDSEKSKEFLQHSNQGDLESIKLTAKKFKDNLTKLKQK